MKLTDEPIAVSEKPPILSRLLEAIADSENDHPGDDRFIVDLTRADAVDAVKRIGDLLVLVSELATALSEASPGHPLLERTTEKEPGP